MRWKSASFVHKKTAASVARTPPPFAILAPLQCRAGEKTRGSLTNRSSSTNALSYPSVVWSPKGKVANFLGFSVRSRSMIVATTLQTKVSAILSASVSV